MSTTRAALRQAIDQELRLARTPTVSRTATGGSTSTVIDTAAVEPDKYWQNYWLYVSSSTDTLAPEGEESLVSAFSGATDTYTVTPAFSAAVGAGDTYELRKYFSAGAIHQAIDHAIEDARNQFPADSVDETVVIKEDTYDYTLPTAVDYLYRVDVLEYPVDYRGTATAGGTATLTDTEMSWDVNGLAGYEVAIYKGTGAGQYGTVGSNTADTLTMTANWTVTPSTDSEYVIKDVVNEPGVTSRCRQYTTVGSTIYFNQALPEGQRLRLTYQPVHTTLATDASTTTVPKTYVVLKACLELLLFAKLVAPEEQWAKNAMSVHDRLEAQLIRYLDKARTNRQPSTFLNRGGATRRRWYHGPNAEVFSRESD